MRVKPTSQDVFNLGHITVLKGNPIRQDANGSFVLTAKKTMPPGTAIGKWNPSHTIFVADTNWVEKIYIKDL